MKKFSVVFLAIALFGLCSFATIRYVARKVSWRHELKFKTLVHSSAAWMEEQIREDLSTIRPEDLSSERIERVLKEHSEKGNLFMLARYQIRNNRLETNYYGELKNHPRVPVMERAFNEIMSVTPLPDLDCIISLSDSADKASFGVPVFAYAKDRSLLEPIILIPDFEALEGHPAMLKEVEKGAKQYPWEKKISKAFWRGAMTGIDFTVENFLQPPRSQLVSASLNHSDWIDARFSFLTQTSEPEKIRVAFANYFGAEAPVRDHLAYKYQILVDGNSCAYSRAYSELFSDCTIFKQESSNIQWYYKGLKPFVHYIPVRSDFSDLVEKMAWANDHDGEARKIARNAKSFAENNLKKSDIRHYLVVLLKEYAKIQSYPSGLCYSQ